MTAPKFLDNDVYNVKDRENRKRPNEIFVGFDKYGKYSVRKGNISNIAYPVRYIRSDLYESAQARIKELETALNETADILNATGNPNLSSKLRAIAGGKDETK